MQQTMTTLKSSDWTVGFNRFEAEVRTIAGLPEESNSPFLVDVGGGHGHQCIQLRNKYPNLSGRLVLQDLPQAVDKLPSIDGVEVMALDFFQAQVVKGNTTSYVPYPSSPSDPILRCQILLPPLDFPRLPRHPMRPDSQEFSRCNGH
jgi:demethylsterigmatocystin 6-O-methyltransferase